MVTSLGWIIQVSSTVYDQWQQQTKLSYEMTSNALYAADNDQ